MVVDADDLRQFSHACLRQQDLTVYQIRESGTGLRLLSRRAQRFSDAQSGIVTGMSGSEQTDESAAVRAADGRLPGARGLATRARLLERTRALLGERSYRDLTAIDIAREAATSPATFYQYFPDVESAVLALAEQMLAEQPTLGDLVRSADWTRPSTALRAAHEVASGFIAFWRRHHAILRVVDLRSAEGDDRFRMLRTRLLNDATRAVADAAVAAGRARGVDLAADPMATGAVLVSMLAHVAAHREGLEAWSIATAETEAVMAEIVYRTITGRSRR
jgi:AcrR family transcriptional regulator